MDTRAFILVYTTDPVPERAAFDVLKDAEAPTYDESGGVMTKELVGPRSRLRVHGDVRWFAESRVDAGSRVRVELADDEGGLLSVREGKVVLDGRSLEPGTTVLWPPGHAVRISELEAERASRIVRVIHGPGEGFVAGPPMPRLR